ncbi:MAG: hypothetical protein RSB66_00280 [Clostridium sp.]
MGLDKRVALLVTSNLSVVEGFNKYILLVIIINIFNLIQHMYKTSLQSLDYEKWCLYVGVFINTITIITMFLISDRFGLVSVYCLYGINYIVLSIVFSYKYIKVLREFSIDNLKKML